MSDADPTSGPGRPYDLRGTYRYSPRIRRPILRTDARRGATHGGQARWTGVSHSGPSAWPDHAGVGPTLRSVVGWGLPATVTLGVAVLDPPWPAASGWAVLVVAGPVIIGAAAPLHRAAAAALWRGVPGSEVAASAALLACLAWPFAVLLGAPVDRPGDLDVAGGQPRWAAVGAALAVLVLLAAAVSRPAADVPDPGRDQGCLDRARRVATRCSVAVLIGAVGVLAFGSGLGAGGEAVGTAVAVLVVGTPWGLPFVEPATRWAHRSDTLRAVVRFDLGGYAAGTGGRTGGGQRRVPRKPPTHRVRAVHLDPQRAGTDEVAVLRLAGAVAREAVARNTPTSRIGRSVATAVAQAAGPASVEHASDTTIDIGSDTDARTDVDTATGTGIGTGIGIDGGTAIDTGDRTDGGADRGFDREELGVAEFDSQAGQGARGIVAELRGGTVLAHAVVVGGVAALAEHAITLGPALTETATRIRAAGLVAVAVAWDGFPRAVLEVAPDPDPAAARPAERGAVARRGMAVAAVGWPPVAALAAAAGMLDPLTAGAAAAAGPVAVGMIAGLSAGCAVALPHHRYYRRVGFCDGARDASDQEVDGRG